MAVVDSALSMSALGAAVPNGGAFAHVTAPPLVLIGDGPPTAVAPQGTIYVQRDANAAAGEPTLWVKGSGGQATPTATGWVASNGAFSASGTLTNAQLLTSGTVPVQAIAAIPTKIIIPIFAVWRQQYTVAYSVNRSLTFRLSGVAVDLVTASQVINTVVPQSGTVTTSPGVVTGNTLAASGADARNTALVIVNTTGTDPGGGDPANTVSWYLEYRVIDRPGG